MTLEIKEALNEIMEIPPIYLHDYIVDYLRKNLPKDDARRLLFQKTKSEFLVKMMEQGYISRQEVLEKIGRKRVEKFFHIMSSLS